MATRSPVVNVMAKASYKAARRLVRDFGEVENLQVSRKGPADFVSTADHQAERTISEELRHARPGWGLLLEEGKEIPSEDSQGRRWIVDPLDGTTNFLHGLPHFAISIAFEERGRVVAGTVYDPVRDELFWAAGRRARTCLIGHVPAGKRIVCRELIAKAPGCHNSIAWRWRAAAVGQVQGPETRSSR